jgi:hypothetical protein
LPGSNRATDGRFAASVPESAPVSIVESSRGITQIAGRYDVVALEHRSRLVAR